MYKKNHKLMGYCLLLLSCLSAGMALPAAAAQDPVAMLQGATDRILSIIKDDPRVVDDQARLRNIASEIIFPHVDFPALSRWVLGKHWRDATPAQRDVFITEFRELLLNTYLRSVTSYRNNKISYQPLRQQPTDGKIVVFAHIEAPGAPVVKAEFRLHQPGQEWLVYDVAIDGISLVATQRSSYSEVIRREGIEGLITQLASRNAKSREAATGAPAQATP